jgi:hypothetical protein
MKKIFLMSIIFLGITFLPKISDAYTVIPIGGTFDGNYLSIACIDIPEVSGADWALVGVSSTTYPQFDGATSYSSCPFDWWKVSTSSLMVESPGVYNLFATKVVQADFWADFNAQNYYYLQFTWNGTTVTDYNAGQTFHNTQFYYSSPAGGQEVASSTGNTLYAGLYLKEQDYVSGGYVRLSYYRLEDLNVAVGSPDLITRFFDLDDIITDGYNTVSTTTGSLGLDGTYVYTMEYRKPSSWYSGILDFLSLGLSNGTMVVSSSTTFVYGTTTPFEKTQAQWKADNQEFMASSTASANVKEYCSFSTNFSMGLCISALFLPNSSDIYLSLNKLKEGIGSRFPFGYITSFADIVATTSTSTLTVLSLDVPPALGLGTPHAEVSINHSLDMILYATSGPFITATASSTETFFAITNRYWSYIVYLGTLLYILGRVIGTQAIPLLSMSSTAQMNKNGVTADEYKLKEWLYNNRPNKRK